MIIRAITLEDKDAYLALLHAAYKSTLDLGIHFVAATADLEVITQHIRANGVYAIELDGKLVSTLSIRFPWGNNPGPYGLPHYGWLATDPDYKQQGLNQQLIEWVEQHILIELLKLPAVTLGTAESHPWLINFYKKLGFNEIGTANLGRGHTTIYLQKILQADLYQQWQARSNKA